MEIKKGCQGYNYKTGDKFVCYELEFNGYIIPEDTLFEIIEIISDDEYKVFFYCENDEHEKNIQILSYDEIGYFRKSSMYDY